MSIVGTPSLLCPAVIRHRRFALPRRSTARAVLLGITCALLTSCDEAPEPQASIPVVSPSSESRALARREWLTQHDRTTPDRWLASRAAGVDVAPDDPSVAAMHNLLMTANERFGDTTRMIANRAVQLEGTLKSRGIDEKAPDIIESFSRAAANARLADGFGAMCQNYVILRDQGMDKDEALKHLAESIGSAGASAAAPNVNSEVR